MRVRSAGIGVATVAVGFYNVGVFGIGGKTFAYNDANRMNAVKQGGVVVESYGYNHRGERVLRAPAVGAVQIALYDEAGQWVGNYSSTGHAHQ